MLIILSPAKTLDETPAPTHLSYTEPDFLKESELLIQELRQLNTNQIIHLMDISSTLAELNQKRYLSFHTPFTPHNAKQALLAFKGDVYTDIAVEHYTKTEWEYAQRSVRILSGLYGLLRPLDLMQPYRLEMKTKLANGRGKDLYEFWGARITEALKQTLQTNHHDTLVNLASQEYFAAVKPALLSFPIITPVFKEERKGKLATIALFAKRARGMMTQFAISHKLQHVEDLKAFNVDNYCFLPDQSTPTEWIFAR